VEERDRPRFGVGALQAFGTLDVPASVTIFVGGNGSGTSTLLEAFAVHRGMNPEGGTSKYGVSTVTGARGEFTFERKESVKANPVMLHDLLLAVAVTLAFGGLFGVLTG
jgi:predicted ATPase